MGFDFAIRAANYFVAHMALSLSHLLLQLSTINKILPDLLYIYNDLLYYISLCTWCQNFQGEPFILNFAHPWVKVHIALIVLSSPLIQFVHRRCRAIVSQVMKGRILFVRMYKLCTVSDLYGIIVPIDENWIKFQQAVNKSFGGIM